MTSSQHPEFVLTPWGPDLEEELFLACQDPDLQVRLPIPVPYTRNDAHQFVTEIAPTFERSGGYNFAIRSLNGPLVGCVSFWALTSSRARGGYWIASAFRGQGLAAAALTRGLDWARNAGFEVVELTIGADNPASLRIASRAGFVQVETLKGYEISPGKFKDTIRFEHHLGT